MKYLKEILSTIVDALNRLWCRLFGHSWWLSRIVGDKDKVVSFSVCTCCHEEKEEVYVDTR